ncbi:MAG: purine-nucleoside phosphorylase, partial [Rhodospirillales bacterium]|nr:purine-nucleoside phosphorylase [Rhodospirillales bacterium]
ADAVNGATVIPFEDLPGFPRPTVQSHAGSLVLGHLKNQPVAIMMGRAHYYESGNAAAMKAPIRTLAACGCDTLVLTNSAGSLKPEVGPGDLMMITDHINFAGVNPLMGEQGNERFVDMTEAYDKGLRSKLKTTAKTLGITLNEGVYIWFSGPNFETPAEIRAARVLGADAVGMSTVPEVLLARWAGLKVAAISVIANPAAGMGEKELTHEMSMAKSAEGAKDLVRLLTATLEDLTDG